ncbi:Esterase/lipase/thioesterase [Steccherinum ochraceum]|uniref:lytic cellulose monooxygenase (C4-dehydrogenating) n=1 Tax=Steccherinum ochraceum TaxID=92696 RepID=A0A4R0RWJ8_9APHY|nr:Esterase/lipase/thioesterase [Steccherinum ochraceum]
MIAAFLPLLTLALSIAPGVVAHGYIEDVTINGKLYEGWHPFTDPYASPKPNTVVRHVPNDGPVLDIHSTDLACTVDGLQGTSAVAEAAAGSKITFHWNQWLADHLGPVSVYMASCNGDCTKFNAASGKWFKIDAAGYDAGKKQWASTQLINNGDKWTSTIPASLAPGQYLIRHEVIALHDAGAPQFYPSCTQLKVTGSGNAQPSGSQVVSIPGIYDSVKFPDIWSDGFKSFTIPGPALFAGGSSSGNGGNDDNNQAPPPPASSSPPKPAGNAGSTPPSTTSSSSTSSISAPAPSSTPAKGSSSPVTTAPSASSTGRCRQNKRRSEKRMAKRHVGFAKRHHH